MKLLTKALEQKLRANNANQNKKDIRPVLKIFNPYGAATWLFSELYPDGDTLYGLCDLGMGTPELGYVSLNELKNIRIGGYQGMLERDKWFEPKYTLAEYADKAREKGSIEA